MGPATKVHKLTKEYMRRKMPARRTTDVHMPLRKTDGGRDNRYSTAQFCKANGQRDMRTTLTGNRK